MSELADDSEFQEQLRKTELTTLYYGTCGVITVCVILAISCFF